MELLIGSLVVLSLCIIFLICTACVYLVVLLIANIKEEIDNMRSDYMNIDGEWFAETEATAYVRELKQRISTLEDLNDRLMKENDKLEKQLEVVRTAKGIDDMQIAHYEDENRQMKAALTLASLQVPLDRHLIGGALTMTLDEAIKHCEEVSEENLKEAEYRKEWHENYAEKDCRECATEHRQLAEWLTELKERRSGGWISCTERMPEPETMVIVACYGSDIVIPEGGETVAECCERLRKECVRVMLGFIGSDGWYGSDYCPMMIRPKYWQPLPEPPEGGADDMIMRGEY